MIFVAYETEYMRGNASKHYCLTEGMIEAKHFAVPASKVKGHVINTDWKVEVHEGFVAIFRNESEKEVVQK